MATAYPAWMSFLHDSGASATRVSPGRVSFSTAILMTLLSPAAPVHLGPNIQNIGKRPSSASSGRPGLDVSWDAASISPAGPHRGLRRPALAHRRRVVLCVGVAV